MDDSHVQNLVDLQFSMQRANSESRTNCQAFWGPGLGMFYTHVCGILSVFDPGQHDLSKG